MDDLILKRRRNLILSSIFAIFFSAGDVEVTTINGMVVTLDVNEDFVVYLFIWFSVLYFFWRYAQIFWEKHSSVLCEAFECEMNILCREEIGRQVISSKVRNWNGEDFEKRMKKVFDVFVEGEDRRLYTAYKRSRIVEGNLMLNLSLHSPGDLSGLISIRKINLWDKKLLAFFFVVIKRSVFGDYIMPIVFFSVALICMTLLEWEGSLCRVASAIVDRAL